MFLRRERIAKAKGESHEQSSKWQYAPFTERRWVIVMTKDSYSVTEISKGACEPLLKNYHYLSGISRGFKSGINVGLLFEGEVVGVCIFTGWPVPELLTGCFGLERKDQAGFWEFPMRMTISTVGQYMQLLILNIMEWQLQNLTFGLNKKMALIKNIPVVGLKV
jgi:hypothetical protein